MAKPRKSPTREQGGRIAFLRIERGLSQEDMARLTGIPLRTYLRIERNEGTNGREANPSIRQLANIARVLGYDPYSDGIGQIARHEWLEWQVFPGGPAEEPPQEGDPTRFEEPRY